MGGKEGLELQYAAHIYYSRGVMMRLVLFCVVGRLGGGDEVDY